MESFNPTNLKSLYIPPKESHKGKNGKLLIIGGSHLFHSASLWSLKVASRIVDLVHYSSVPENNAIVAKLTEEFRDGIIVPRGEIESYIEEDDCVLVGPGMVRADNETMKQFSLPDRQAGNVTMKNLKDIIEIEDEGVQTYYLTKYLLEKYPNKKWVIDAGALQMMELSWIPSGAILTPHQSEFERLKLKIKSEKLKMIMENEKIDDQVKEFAKEYKCTVLLKGVEDIVCSSNQCVKIEGGKEGMSKGGTGDVLAGLVAALYSKNDAFLAASAASYINKKVGEDLSEKMGIYFNASDLTDQIPQTMKRLLL